MEPDLAPLEGDFVRKRVGEDLRSGRHKGLVTRFPPEPNGHLHVGHAKAICLNFTLAKEWKGRCYLRMDDTNPERDYAFFAEGIQEMVQWLGFQWDRLCYASDYFPQLFQGALELIRQGKAYVCDLTGEEIREYRGTLTQGGKESPFRGRSIEENLHLFQAMARSMAI